MKNPVTLPADDLIALVALAHEMASWINESNAGTPSYDLAAEYMAKTIARVADALPLPGVAAGVVTRVEVRPSVDCYDLEDEWGEDDEAPF